MRDSLAKDRAADCFRASRWLHGYAKGKVKWDPAFSYVAERLPQEPLLDIGCGMGLLAAYFREKGFEAPLTGLDTSPEKIALAREKVATHYQDLEFHVGDARELPEFSGTVVLMDVLHYMNDDQQQGVLEEIANRVSSDGRAFIRIAIRDGSWRYYTTCLEEGIIRLTGWIRGGECNFPSIDEVCAPFRRLGFRETVRPMWGNTPFNSYLFEFQRSGD